MPGIFLQSVVCYWPPGVTFLSTPKTFHKQFYKYRGMLNVPGKCACTHTMGRDLCLTPGHLLATWLIQFIAQVPNVDL